MNEDNKSANAAKKDNLANATRNAVGFFREFNANYSEPKVNKKKKTPEKSKRRKDNDVLKQSNLHSVKEEHFQRVVNNINSSQNEEVEEKKEFPDTINQIYLAQSNTKPVDLTVPSPEELALHFGQKDPSDQVREQGNTGTQPTGTPNSNANLANLANPLPRKAFSEATLPLKYTKAREQGNAGTQPTETFLQRPKSNPNPANPSNEEHAGEGNPEVVINLESLGQAREQITLTSSNPDELTLQKARIQRTGYFSRLICYCTLLVIAYTVQPDVWIFKSENLKRGAPAMISLVAELILSFANNDDRLFIWFVKIAINSVIAVLLLVYTDLLTEPSAYGFLLTMMIDSIGETMMTIYNYLPDKLALETSKRILQRVGYFSRLICYSTLLVLAYTVQPDVWIFKSENLKRGAPAMISLIAELILNIANNEIRSVIWFVKIAINGVIAVLLLVYTDLLTEPSAYGFLLSMMIDSVAETIMMISEHLLKMEIYKSFKKKIHCWCAKKKKKKD